jgi:hypothetical protein
MTLRNPGVICCSLRPAGCDEQVRNAVSENYVVLQGASFE